MVATRRGSPLALGFGNGENFVSSDALSLSIFSPDFPIPITILPQLGSEPATAVLTKGELAIEKQIFFAFAIFFSLTRRVDVYS